MNDLSTMSASELAEVRELRQRIEKFTAGLEPELVEASLARSLMEEFVGIGRSVDFTVAALAPKVHDPAAVARSTGTSVGQAKATIEMGYNLKAAPELGEALKSGAVSIEQASEIARAEASAPGVVDELVKLAKDQPFIVLKETARRIKLEAEQHRGLGERQRAARGGRHHSDELGMVNVHLRFQPHVGTAIVNRAEADAQRLYKQAKKETGRPEPFECYLADAFEQMLAGKGKGRTTRPELVVLIDYETIAKGWKLTPSGISKIPGVGPVDPSDVRDIARDAVVNVVIKDGKDLRNWARYGRCVPPELKTAMELGKAPDFDGPKCVRCGNRFRPERDHIEPVVALGPTKLSNLDWLCDPCHDVKTEEDRKAHKLKPRAGPSDGSKPDRIPRAEPKPGPRAGARAGPRAGPGP